MRLRSFLGSNLADAMNQVRAALGDDAIIVATRDEDGPNGVIGVRVTAALDENPLPASPAAQKNNGQHADELPEPYQPPVVPDEDLIDEIADTLSRHGTPPAIGEKIVTQALRNPAPTAAETLATALAATLKFHALAATGESAPNGTTARHILLLGPPGAGKTAMVGKLAARAALAGKRVAIITTDLARAGGVAQLQAYTSSLRIPLVQVEDVHALPDALAVHAACELVFVDTTGRNPADAADAAEAKLLVKCVVGRVPTAAATVLVLPAGLDAADGAELATAFKALGATHLLTTRLDLARRLGSLLAVAHDSRLLLCEASASPGIADGLTPLDAASLAERLLNPLGHAMVHPGNIPANVTPPAASSAAKPVNYGTR